MPDYFSLVDMRKFDLNPSEAGIVGEMLRRDPWLPKAVILDALFAVRKQRAVKGEQTDAAA